MGSLAHGALCETTGEEKVQARGTSVMRDVIKDMKSSDVVGRDGFLTNGTSVIKGAKVTAGTGRVVVIKLGICGVGRVLLASDKIGCSVVISFERRAKIQNKC